MDKKQILEKFYDIVASDSEQARSYLLKLNYTKDGYLLSQIALTYRDEAIFFKNGKMRKQFIEDKLFKAKRYIDRAFKLQPNCRDVLYLKGRIYAVLGERITAIDCFLKIMDLEFSQEPENNCSESDLNYIKMLENDAHFELYRLFKATNMKLARKFLKRYKERIKEGVNTIYYPLSDFL